jgi:hypothetical protein
MTGNAGQLDDAGTWVVCSIAFIDIADETGSNTADVPRSGLSCSPSSVLQASHKTCVTRLAAPFI